MCAKKEIRGDDAQSLYYSGWAVKAVDVYAVSVTPGTKFCLDFS